jgi:Ca2+-binding RTX toxin-like protein
LPLIAEMMLFVSLSSVVRRKIVVTQATIKEKQMAVITGTALNDTLTATSVDLNGFGDEVYGLGGNDTLTGFIGNDKLFGGDGTDTLYGMDGHDSLDGGTGNDWLYGGEGNDGLAGGAGNDFLDGGNGFDAVDYRGISGTRGVTVDLRITTAQNTRAAGYDTIVSVEQVWGSNLNDSITGSEGANDLYGFNGSDVINGAGGNDNIWGGFGETTGNRLSGGAGNDSIVGSAGADTLRGDAGNDRLTGSLGADQLTGGTGADRFVFDNLTDSTATAADTITDFNGAEDFVILTPLQFTSSHTFIGSAAFSATGGAELRVTSANGIQTLLVDADGNGTADMTIKVIGTALAADDFLYSPFGGFLI